MCPNKSDESKDERSNPSNTNDIRGDEHNEKGKESERQVVLPVGDEQGEKGGGKDHLDDHGDEPNDAAGDRDLAGRGALALNHRQDRVVPAEARSRLCPIGGM